MKKLLAILLMCCVFVLSGCSLLDNNVGFKDVDTTGKGTTVPSAPSGPSENTTPTPSSSSSEEQNLGLDDAYDSKLNDDDSILDLFAGILITYAHDYNVEENTAAEKQSILEFIEQLSVDLLTRTVGQYGGGYIDGEDQLISPEFTNEQIAFYNAILGTNYTSADMRVMIDAYIKSRVMEVPVQTTGSGLVDAWATADEDAPSIVTVANTTEGNNKTVTITVNTSGITTPVVKLYKLPTLTEVTSSPITRTESSSNVIYSYTYDTTAPNAAIKGIYRLSVSYGGATPGVYGYYVYACEDSTKLAEAISYKAMTFDNIRYAYYYDGASNYSMHPWNWSLDNDCDLSNYLTKYIAAHNDTLRLAIAKVLRDGSVEDTYLAQFDTLEEINTEIDDLVKTIDHTGLTATDCDNLVDFILDVVIGDGADDTYESQASWSKDYRTCFTGALLELAEDYPATPIADQIFVKDIGSLSMALDTSDEEDEDYDEDYDEESEDDGEDESEDTDQFDFDPRFTLNIKSILIVPSENFYKVGSAEVIDGYIHVISAVLGTNPEGHVEDVNVAVKYRYHDGTEYVEKYWFPTGTVSEDELNVCPINEPFNADSTLRDGTSRTYHDYATNRDTDFESYGFKLQKKPSVVYFHKEAITWRVYKFDNGTYNPVTDASITPVNPNSFTYDGRTFTLREEDNFLISDGLTLVSEESGSYLPADSTLAPGGMIADGHGYYPYLDTTLTYFDPTDTFSSDRDMTTYEDFISGHSALLGVTNDFDYVELMFSLKQGGNFTISLSGFNVA